MAEQKIELRRIRDFGEVISDTFVFLRQHAGPLLKSFLAISAVFMIALGIFNSAYESRTSKLLRGIFTGRSSSLDRLGTIFNINYFMVLLFTLLTTISMQVIVAVYMKYYLEHKQQPGIQDIWTLFKRYFIKVFFFELLAYLAIIFGCIFCLLPGIYLGVVLAPLSLVIVMEDKGFQDSWQRCFDLIRENFWPSLGLYIVAYILYAIGAGIIAGSMGIIGLLGGYLTTSDLGTYVVAITAFIKSFSLFFYIIYFICIALNYFSLVERRDGTGLLGRIDTIGNNFTGPRESEEQF